MRPISLLLRRFIQVPDLLEEHKKSILYNVRKELLIQKASTSNEPGITNEKIADREVVVSMASYGNRVSSAFLAVESIMQQSIKPNRIILCIPEEFKSMPLPQMLQRQEKRGLTVLFTKDIWSFKKIVPALKSFPESIIITCDDDCLYNVDFVENLLRSHSIDPSAIWGNRIHEITFDKKGNINYYSKWNWEIPNTDKSSNKFLITSVAGVLYPPHSLYKDVTDESIFMDISKYNDDIWCYAMAVLQGTKIRRSFTHSENGMDYLSVEESQLQRLSLDNVSNNGGESRNDKIVKAVFDKYNIWDIIKE